MKLDLKPLLRGEINRMAIDIFVEPEAPEGVTFTDKARLIGEITNQGGYMRLTAEAEVPYEGVCARCLDPVSGVFRIPFDRTIVAEGVLTEEQEEDNVDEYLILENGMLDVEDAVCEALILCFPMRLLCSEDCPGLCPKCGKKLRDGPCNCSTKEIDPRWAALLNWHPSEESGETDEADPSKTDK